MNNKNINGVSVIIPVYNRCFAVCRAIDSVIEQYYKDIEIIVIDDASTDDVSTVISERYPDVILITNEENRGVSYSRNVGIKRTSNEWIAFLDSDDQWEKEKIIMQMESLMRSGNKICHTDEVWYRRGQHLNQLKKHKKMGGEFFLSALPLCIISPSSILLHKTVLDDAGMFDEDFEVCEDYELWLKLTLLYQIDFIEKPLTIKHGGHDDQLSRKYFGMDRWRIKALIKTLKNLSEKMTDFEIEEVKREICKKAKIYANGAKKRGKLEEFEKYSAIIETYKETE